MITSKLGQQLVGVVLLLVGSGATAWAWNSVLTRGSYGHEAVAFAPAFAIVGLAGFLFPIDMEKVRDEHGVDRPRQWAYYPPEWKVLLLVAIAVGLGNWLAISQYKTNPPLSAKPAEVETSRRGAKTDSEPPQESDASRGFVGSLWIWFRFVLLFGGALLGLFGMIWDKTANLARLFGAKANPDRGFWLAVSGLAMMLSGGALLYFFRV